MRNMTVIACLTAASLSTACVVESQPESIEIIAEKGGIVLMDDFQAGTRIAHLEFDESSFEDILYDWDMVQEGVYELELDGRFYHLEFGLDGAKYTRERYATALDEEIEAGRGSGEYAAMLRNQISIIDSEISAHKTSKTGSQGALGLICNGLYTFTQSVNYDGYIVGSASSAATYSKLNNGPLIARTWASAVLVDNPSGNANTDTDEDPTDTGYSSSRANASNYSFDCHGYNSGAVHVYGCPASPMIMSSSEPCF